jgi:heat-inducible transcriptional repressor
MLDERRKKILWAIIQSHIDLNTPIGSSLITRRYPIGLSPATVRNIMASLEKMGYIQQPHTSAGRVPTEKGFRFYVDTLLDEGDLSPGENIFPDLLKRLHNSEKDSNDLIQEATKTLSLMSQYMALAIPLKKEDMALKQVKFIKYDRKKILAIFISENGLVKHTLIETEKTYKQHQLDTAANILNTKFVGLTVQEMREAITDQLLKEKEAYNRLIADLLSIFKDVVAVQNNEVSFNGFSGASFLPDFVDLKQIKQILKAVEGNNFVLKLLDRMDSSQGIQVFVGMEHIIPAMKELSMVVSTYRYSTRSSGAIGIIGPTRMNYRKLIPIVDHTAKTLTRILSSN